MSNISNYVCSTNSLTKKYGKVTALNNVSIAIPQGSIYGLLGPNGSGKTTFLSIVTNILLPNSGDVQLFGENPKTEHRKRIGTLLETPNFYHYLNAIDNLKITASIRGYGENDIERVLKIVNLWERRNSKFSTYSLGMKQRLAIAATLLGNPKVLILDEPTNGLDPNGIAEIRNLIIDLNKNGITIIIASHMLDEIQKVCTHVAILKQGNLLLNGPLKEMDDKETTIRIKADDLAKAKLIANNFKGIKEIKEAEDFLDLVFDKGVCSATEINKYFFENGIILSGLSIFEKSLEAKFLELTSN